MSIEIQGSFIGDLSVQDYQILLKLNSGKCDGHMYRFLTDDYHKYHQIFIARSGKKIVGWALAAWERRKYREVNLFVHKKYRRRGIGTKLFLFVEKECGPLHFNNHSNITQKFLDKLEKNHVKS